MAVFESHVHVVFKNSALMADVPPLLSVVFVRSKTFVSMM